MSETIFKIDGQILTAERTMSASRQILWDAWTKPELFVQWWGPRGWETSVKNMMFKANSNLLYCMTCNDPAQKEWFGQESWGKFTYKSIEPIKGFTFTDAFCNSEGVLTPGMPEIQIAVRFYEVEGSTKMVSIADFGSEEALKQVMDMGMKEGMRQTWDQLEELLI